LVLDLALLDGVGRLIFDDGEEVFDTHGGGFSGSVLLRVNVVEMAGVWHGKELKKLSHRLQCCSMNPRFWVMSRYARAKDGRLSINALSFPRRRVEDPPSARQVCAPPSQPRDCRFNLQHERVSREDLLKSLPTIIVPICYFCGNNRAMDFLHDGIIFPLLQSRH
jgi:hypothetical protein